MTDLQQLRIQKLKDDVLFFIEHYKKLNITVPSVSVIDLLNEMELKELHSKFVKLQKELKQNKTKNKTKGK